MSFTKQSYDSYDWADTEDLFKQLKVQQDRFSIANKTTIPGDQMYVVVTNEHLQSLKDGIATLCENKFIAAERDISANNIIVPAQNDYLEPKHFKLIQTELDKIARLDPCFTHCASHCGGHSSCDFSSCSSFRPSCSQNSGFGFGFKTQCFTGRGCDTLADFSRNCRTFAVCSFGTRCNPKVWNRM